LRVAAVVQPSTTQVLKVLVALVVVHPLALLLPMHLIGTVLPILAVAVALSEDVIAAHQRTALLLQMVPLVMEVVVLRCSAYLVLV
jgi:hypothetical protein